MTESAASESSIPELLSRLPEELSALVHQEIRLAQAELQRKLRRTALGAAVLAAAGVAGGMSLGAATTLLLRITAKKLPPATSAAFTMVALGGAGAGLAIRGVQLIRESWPAVPEQAVAVAKGGG